MSILAGTQGITVTVDTGEFDCPHCMVRAPFNHNVVNKKAVLFSMPVINLKRLGEYIECQLCEGTYRKDILDFDSLHEQHKFEALVHTGIKRVMILMMLADGKIEYAEKQVLKQVYRQVCGTELSDETLKAEILDCSHYTRSIEEFLRDLFPHLNEHSKEMILKAAGLVSLADGELEPREMKLLRKFARSMHFHPSRLDEILAGLG